MKPQDSIKFNEKGLVPVITQDHLSNEILMMAWMNQEALELSIETKKAVYFSRSRNKLWHKGEESGNVQQLKELRLDCDSDVILMQVEQKGGIACHTGRASCFYRVLKDGQWTAIDPVIKDPKELYK